MYTYIDGEERKTSLTVELQLRYLEESNKYRRNDGIRKQYLLTILVIIIESY